MTAFEASASVTSNSVTPPTPAWMTRASTSSLPSFSTAAVIASTEPCTSPLRTIGNSLRPVGLEVAHHVGKRGADRGAAGGRFLALLALAIFGDLPRARFRFDDGDAISRFRRAGEAEHLDRHRRARRLDRLALVVDERADAAPMRAGDDEMRRPAACRAGRERWRPGRGRDRAAPRSPFPRRCAPDRRRDRAIRPGARSPRAACRG